MIENAKLPADTELLWHSEAGGIQLDPHKASQRAWSEFTRLTYRQAEAGATDEMRNIEELRQWYYLTDTLARMVEQLSRELAQVRSQRPERVMRIVYRDEKDQLSRVEDVRE